MAVAEATFSLDAAAQAVRMAYAAGPIPPLRDSLHGATVAEAYAIQAINTAHWRASGRKRSGAKIGLTAKSVQTQLGVDQPDFGTLFADMQIADGGEVSAGVLLQPKVEAEIAFTLARTPDTRSFDTLAASVAYAQAAIEIVDSRIANWNIGIVDTIADNASSGLYVLGSTQKPLSELDLRLCGMVLEHNGDVASLGTGAACLGNPLNALAWLARTMAANGDPLQEGDVILAGALGPMVAAKPGDTFEAEIGGLGAVSVRFAP